MQSDADFKRDGRDRGTSKPLVALETTPANTPSEFRPRFRQTVVRHQQDDVPL